MTQHTPDPLPRQWLPDPVGPAHPADEAPWEARLQGLMAAAEPTLARLRASAIPWWSVLAAWWRPLVSAAALGAAAAGLALLPRVPPRRTVTTAAGTATLSVVVGNGEPAALWAGVGAEADPALALIVWHGGQR